MKKMIKKVFLITILVTAGVIAVSYAGPNCKSTAGGGFNYHGCFGDIYNMEGLTDKEKKVVEKESTDYLKATDKLRADIYNKYARLKEELLKKKPCGKTAAKLQGELSSLEAKLALKRIEHLLNLKKINPDIIDKAAAQCPYKSVCKGKGKMCAGAKVKKGSGAGCPFKGKK